MDEQKNTVTAEKMTVPATTKPAHFRLSYTVSGGTSRRFFGRPFLIYLGILVILALSFVFYVRHILAQYEASQPDNVALYYATCIQKAAKKGRMDGVVSLGAVRNEMSATDEQLKAYEPAVAKGAMTVRCIEEKDDILTYALLCNNYVIAHVDLHYSGQRTWLAIFTADIWEIGTVTATPFRFDVSLSAGLTATMDGNVLAGEHSEDGKTVHYQVASLAIPSIVLTDLLGNEKPYDQCGDGDFDGYVVRVPSNYTLKGKTEIPVSAAILTDMDEFQYAQAYSKDIPRQAEYDIRVLGDTYSLTVFDNAGNALNIADQGETVIFTEQATAETLPDTLVGEPDPLAMAQRWSLLMTRDLWGPRYGFYQMEGYLIKGSYLHTVAWQWVTGVDITFTSGHTLANPAFQVAEATNFVVYGDTAFSCDIHLEKELYLSRGGVVNDVIHSTFYFVYCDDTDDGKNNPHWAIADKRDILEQGGEAW